LRLFRAATKTGHVSPGRCPLAAGRLGCAIVALSGRRREQRLAPVPRTRVGRFRNLALAGPSKAPTGRNTLAQGNALGPSTQRVLEPCRGEIALPETQAKAVPCAAKTRPYLSPTGAATFQWFTPATPEAHLSAPPMRWHGHLAHDSRAGSPFHFHGFTPNPSPPGFSRRLRFSHGL
jgi:hypothetical protein